MGLLIIMMKDIRGILFPLSRYYFFLEPGKIFVDFFGLICTLRLLCKCMIRVTAGLKCYEKHITLAPLTSVLLHNPKLGSKIAATLDHVFAQLCDIGTSNGWAVSFTSHIQ